MKIAVMGCGTVGSGVVEIVSEYYMKLAERCYEKEIEVKYILDLRDFKGTPFEKKVVHDIDVIVNDPEIGVVVEAMGGTHPAFEFCLKCLNAGKSVVTSNKQLVSEKAEELFAAAEEHNAAFRFGASVCGGIPVIRTMFTGLASDRILSFAGILNGTTNFILTKMIEEKTAFPQALKLAQDNGFAEKDPTADIEGIDACRKTAILASIAFEKHVYPDEIHTEGITGISLKDIDVLKKEGYSVKLLGRASLAENGKINAMVSPAVIKSTNMLSGVTGVFNALMINGEKTGDIMLYGKGAGKDATASAVVADVLDCIRDGGFEPVYSWKNGTHEEVNDYLETETEFFVSAAYSPDIEADPSFRVICKEEDSIYFFTSKIREKDLSSALDGIDVKTTIRVL